MRISISFILFLLLTYSNGKFLHLYHTDQNKSCLYSVWPLIGYSSGIIPYCFQSESIHVDFKCNNHGNPITFTELQAKHFTTDDLYQWQAPIDLIDSYGKFDRRFDIDRVFCNCTNFQWFGLYCEFTFQSFESYLHYIIEAQFKSRKPYLETQIFTFTTYKGIACQPHGFGLDWRHICNGLIDCENSEDEINCHLLESNECDSEHEFRCKSGMCIEKRFAYDFMIDCLDRSDEINLTPYNHCFFNPSMDCEEFQCASMDNYNYPCGDGECVSSPMDGSTNLGICYNGRNKWFFTTYVNVTENFCQSCLICFLNKPCNFPPKPFTPPLKECQNLLSNSSCLTECKDFFLSDVSLIYPDVRLFYASAQKIIPKLICYDDEKCNLYPPTINQSGLTCRNTDDFYGKEDCQGFATFLPHIHRQFAACKLPYQLDLSNSSRLFSCPYSYRYLSFHRLNDRVIDCPTSDDDENYKENICQFNLSSRFQCLSSDDCIPRKYLHYLDEQTRTNNVHCKDASNQIFPLICKHRDDLGCHHRRGFQIPIDYFLFQEICNGQVHPELIEDENDCDEWTRICNLKYRQCDGIINCFDKLDEKNCYNEVRWCGINETATECLSYPNPYAKKGTCLPISWINNGKTDCFGGVDEDIYYCARNYPNNPTKRFHCFNDSKCILLEDLCDGFLHCPYHDDETICPIGMNTTKCLPGTYFCNPRLKPSWCASKSIRCDGSRTCFDSRLNDIGYHDEMFCNMIAKPIHHRIFSLSNHNQYPPTAIITHTQNINNQQKPRLSLPLKSDSTLDVYRCHRGIVIKSSMDGELCLCPPSYYGQTCEYQSERISIILNIQSVIRQQSPEIVYKLLIRLQTFSNMFFDHIELYYSTVYDELSIYKQAVYLRAPPLYTSYSVVIDIFQISRTNVHYHSSLYYNISFPFLPVNRLATKVIIDDPRHSTSQCEKNCSSNGQCRVYSNNIYNNFCLCHPGWSGEFCQIRKQMNCSPSSLIFDAHCICPLALFGRSCHAYIDPCSHSSYCRNGAVCIPLDIRFHQFICVCPPEFYGRYCQYSSGHVNITMNNMWPEDRSRTQIPLVIVHLANITSQIGLATISNRYIFTNVKLGSNVIGYSKTSTLPTFVFVEIYFDIERQRQYHLVALIKNSVHMVVTSILSSNRCPQVNEFLDPFVMSLAYIKRVKYYNRPCLVLDTRCFYDESYICLCDNNAFLDCVRFDHSASNCSTNDLVCLNGGHCYQPIQKSAKFEFACVCPRCYFGDQCQFTMTKYTISLDALLDQQILIGKPFSQQLPIVKWMFALVVIIVISGFIANGLSILTFAQIKPRQMGCGWYLLVTCIVSQLGIIVFGARFLYLLQIRTNYLGSNNQAFLSFCCISLEFLLSILPVINDWLTTCVTIERTMIAVRGVQFNKRKSVYYAKFIIFAVVTLNIVSALHEPFHRRLIIDPQYGNDIFWCVTDYPRPWINLYDIITNLVHLIIPFTINFISIFILLINVVRRKVALSDIALRKTPIRILGEQLSLYKAFLFSPFILILLELPRLIFSFAFSCIQEQWQKQLFLASYIISSLPMMLTLVIFVLPKTLYKDELIQILKRMKSFLKKH